MAMGLVLYNLVLPLVLLMSLPRLLLKMRRRGGYGRDFWQRFGRYDGPLGESLAQGERPWWLHAVSVGEVLVALKLIEAIRAGRPAQPLILSTTSSTGYATARDKAPGEVRVIYHPLDLPGIVQGVLRRLRPRLIVLMESELWPNLITAAAKRAIPVAIANARLSPRSARRYARLRPLAGAIFGCLEAVLTQGKADADGWVRAGVPSHRIHCVGSIKFDPAAHRFSPGDQLSGLRAIVEDLWGDVEGSYTILLGSSHAGEELAVTKVYQRLRRHFCQVRLLLVPRHFERAPEVLRELRRLGLPVVQRSRWPEDREEAGAEPPILLVDSTGELRTWYALADAVVMGKSFLARGGQNPVEPIMAGCPVVVGPHMENFAALTEEMIRRGGMLQLPDVDALEGVLASWIRDPSLPDGLVKAALESLEAHAGAAERTVEKLLAIVEEAA